MNFFQSQCKSPSCGGRKPKPNPGAPHLFFNHWQNFSCFLKKFLNSIILMLWYSLQNVGKETKLLIMVQGHLWSSIQNLKIDLKNYFHMTNDKNYNSNKFQKVFRNFKMMTEFPKNYQVLNCWPSSNILPIADQFSRQYRRKRLCRQ